MTLRELIAGAGLDVAVPGDGEDPEITGLAYSTAAVAPGTLFFCVPGFRADGHDFAPQAVEQGAVALVCERPLGLGVPEVVVPSVRAAMAPLAAFFNGNPTERLRVVGVTGTNGKTTTAFLVRHILEAAGIRTGLLGTVVSIVGGQEREVERTTPEAVDLQATFREMLEGGDAACAMEVSSHALSLHRADAIHFACAAFTNLTQDHLDFHGTIQEYFGAKRKLFTLGRGARTAVAVINRDDSFGRDLAGELEAAGHTRVLTFGIDGDADYTARDVSYGARGASFTCTGPGGSAEVTMPLPGLFNVYNALGALAAAGALDVPLADAAAALREAPGVPGRFEPVDEGQAFTVLVDYAHTPDSVENVLNAGREVLRKEGGGRLICVLGAGGDRDREKRPLMGAIARRYADVVVFTSDNPRSEDPNAIIADIVRGAHEIAPALGPNLSTMEVRPDRRKAIERAVELAQPGDMVIIAGKGHEQGQEFEDGRKIPFDDRDVAREALRARNAVPSN